FLFILVPATHSTPTLFPYTTLFRSGCDRSPGCRYGVPANSPSERDVPTPGQLAGLNEPDHPLSREPQPERRFHSAHFAISSRLQDRKSTRLNSSHVAISYAVFCLKT